MDPKYMNEKSLLLRVRNFAVALGVTLAFIYVVLPFVTSSVPILHRMSLFLDDNGIDPTRYYYTDVEQVKESERYLATVMEGR
jgi:hypothetical protein